MAQQSCTTYEVAAVHEGGRRVVLGFTPRRSLPGLVAVIQGAPKAMAGLGIASTGPEPRVIRGRDAAFIADGWKIGFTGRTKLDCQAAA